MLRETENTLAAASATLYRNDRLGRRLGTDTMPALQALTAQQSGTRSETTGALQNASDRDRLLASSSVITGEQSLNFSQWAQIACGIRQRMEAVSACLDQVFMGRGLPAFLLQSSSVVRLLRTFKDQIGEVTRKSISWGWLASTDLNIAADGQIMVIDQNLSSPTGIELLARLIDRTRAESVIAFNDLARRMAESVVTYGEGSDAASTVVLDPCRYNPTFRENEFLARAIGAQIAHAGELVVTKDGVELVSGMKRTRIHTIVHRVDDDLLDPNCFRPDSLVGLPGLCKAWKNGRVNLVNPLGSTAANIRSFVQLVPTMIREFLGEEPALQIAPSRECSVPDAMQELVEDPTRFAVRTNDPMHPARSYFGDATTADETLTMLNAVRRHPSKFVTRSLLPDSERRGFNLRVFSSMGKGFYMPRCGIGRQCQSDGGATLAINDDVSACFIG
ncbi:MAG: circularly permuted type 2 ATP-grasp protein [Planctomycetaceae bacterium]